ncbi:hypothetical protein D8674_022850 [Pyrus ussuriensis x Pyrus communis]|uniref:Uncharacterized protein n=1 Tax=Pyrus ussuriensis x Pyrus communis TaxID=2448454 RepID=A0A5N5GRH5_9ROSA|nr:hypothetical protein D8674_022850 [Pyrus ussuriensis x Pyrus communis]
MSHKSLDSRHSVDSCAFQLHGWRPFQLQQQQTSTPTSKTLDSSDPKSSGLLVHTKRPCLSNRTTSFSIDAIDMSRLTLVDDDRTISGGHHTRNGSFRFIAKKRRRRGSRSVSGRSSERSGTRRCCSVGASAAYGTCSDFPVAVGTDSSGELFGNGDANWASDMEVGGVERRRMWVLGLVPLGVLMLRGMSPGTAVNRVIVGTRSSAMAMSLMRRRRILGYCFGAINLENLVICLGLLLVFVFMRIVTSGFPNCLIQLDIYIDASLVASDADSMMETVGENTFADQKSHHRLIPILQKCLPAFFASNLQRLP